MLDMKNITNKIIAVIDRILWASRMASLTSPTYWGRSIHGDESSPWISAIRSADHSADQERERRGAEHRTYAHA